MTTKIKVMLVDDSAVIRQTLGQLLSADPELSLIGAHSNPIFAMRAMEQQWPDVLVLDIEMPGMDGLTFLRSLMRSRPLPVIICSSLTMSGARSSVEALAAGAVEIFAKPMMSSKEDLLRVGRDIIQAVKSAAKAKIVKQQQSGALNHAAQQQLLARATNHDQHDQARLLVIGTSTGGTQALEFILSKVPATLPPIAIVQHMPAAFTKAFAERMDHISAMTVVEAEDNQLMRSGHAYIAPGGLHLQVEKRGHELYTVVRDGPPVSRHKPSVNVLFSSVAREIGSAASGFILTGMGDDGARGLLEMQEQGAVTYAQDEASSVVFGMPKEAIKLGAVNHVLSLQEISVKLSKIRP
ncbi:protein-glutamate methylesterase/protein-glutamine glutaminase [Rheinheimera texasensis]|uniref:protein-glutamate methylesterase/protein-glutamine glutaminase n=1 Tax=Rheinheimera texasensis TaxID=306205 RepID=UPI0004E1466F|nr:chemotaxis response regulator protein-glutamate methylesterase [Rheinheimera texasensis]